MPNFQGKVTLQNCPVVTGTVQPWPVDYQASDFAPGGSEASAAQAAGKYFHLQGDTQLTAFMNNGELREGLYYVEGKVTISKGSLHGHVTIVATKEINISGTGENWQPYTRCLFLLSTKAVSYNQAAINISGGSSRWEGVIYTPNGGLQISGSGNTIPRGALIGRGVHLSGGNLNLTGMDFGDCASAAVTNQPPVVNAGPDQAIALPASAALAGNVFDDG